jgi:hypothetical protein
MCSGTDIPAGVPLTRQEDSVHIHDPFRCPAHARDCDCPDPENWVCNPYHAAGYCPDDIEVMPQ